MTMEIEEDTRGAAVRIVSVSYVGKKGYLHKSKPPTTHMVNVWVDCGNRHELKQIWKHNVAEPKKKLGVGATYVDCVLDYHEDIDQLMNKLARCLVQSGCKSAKHSNMLMNAFMLKFQEQEVIQAKCGRSAHWCTKPPKPSAVVSGGSSR